MCKCWDLNPAVRPTFQDLIAVLSNGTEYGTTQRGGGVTVQETAFGSAGATYLVPGVGLNEDSVYLAPGTNAFQEPAGMAPPAVMPRRQSAASAGNDSVYLAPGAEAFSGSSAVGAASQYESPAPAVPTRRALSAGGSDSDDAEDGGADYLSVTAHLEDFGAGGSDGDEYLTISQHNGGGGGGVGVDARAVEEHEFDSDSDWDC